MKTRLFFTLLYLVAGLLYPILGSSQPEPSIILSVVDFDTGGKIPEEYYTNVYYRDKHARQQSAKPYINDGEFRIINHGFGMNEFITITADADGYTRQTL